MRNFSIAILDWLFVYLAKETTTVYSEHKNEIWKTFSQQFFYINKSLFKYDIIL